MGVQHHFQRARAKYAYMLKLPHDVTFSELVKNSGRFEQCRWGSKHARWRQGYFGVQLGILERDQNGARTAYGEGLFAARMDSFPMVPPGLEIKDAAREWGREFERFWIKWLKEEH